MPKYTLVYDLRLSMLKQTVELDHEPTDDEAQAILDDMAGADLCNVALDPPEIEVVEVYEHDG